MRSSISSISFIALGLALVTCHIANVEAGSRRKSTPEDNMEMEAFGKTFFGRTKIKSGFKEVKKLKTGSIRTNRIVNTPKGSEIIRSRIVHMDESVTYFLAGIESEEIANIESKDIPLRRVEKRTTVAENSLNQKLRTWATLPRVASIEDRDKGLKSWYVAQRGVHQGADLLKDAVNEMGKEQKALRNYIESKYQSPVPLRNWTKLKRVSRFKMAEPSVVLPSDLKDYLESRYKKSEKEFPEITSERGRRIGNFVKEIITRSQGKIPEKKLMLGLEIYDSMRSSTETSDGETDDDDDDDDDGYDSDLGNPEFLIGS